MRSRGNLIMVTGGTRSGKSAFAEGLAKGLGGPVTYIATGVVGDEEMALRVERHRARRPIAWETLEAPTDLAGALGEVAGPGRVVLVDCLNFYVANLLLGNEGLSPEKQEIKILRDIRLAAGRAFRSQAAVIVVANEVGMSLVSPEPLGRRFQELAGRANQIFANLADEVYLVVAGQPLKIKGGQKPESSRGRLRTGYTTGASAAAAAKAAAMVLAGQEVPRKVAVASPSGTLWIEVREAGRIGEKARGVVIKDGGDDPDVTSGLAVEAEVAWGPPGVILQGGSGVGVVTRPGLPVAVGQPAINPVPGKMITASVEEVLPHGMGAVVTISVPGGSEVARRTMNPRLGIDGGISILGTTGVVRPMSLEALRDSLPAQLNQAWAMGHDVACLTPGAMGSRAARFLGVPESAVVQASNFVGFMLERCRETGFKGAVLLGHVGKLIKVAAGVFDTHSRVADVRGEALTAYAALAGAPRSLLEKLLDTTTVEAGLAHLEAEGFAVTVLDMVARRAAERSAARAGGKLRVGVVLTNLRGGVLAVDNEAKALGRLKGWNL